MRRSIDRPVDVAATLSTLSLVKLRLGDTAGARVDELEALSIFRTLGNRIGEAIGLLHLGQISAYIGDDDDARSCFEQCDAIAREVKHREVEGECERMRGEIALYADDLAAARTRFAHSHEIFRVAGDKRDEATSLWWLGKTDLAADDLASARTRLCAALRAFEAIEMREERVVCIEDHARLAYACGNAEDAARLYGAASEQRERLALARPPRIEARWREDVAATRSALGDVAFEAAWSEGRGWEIDAAIRKALDPADAPIAA